MSLETANQTRSASLRFWHRSESQKDSVLGYIVCQGDLVDTSEVNGTKCWVGLHVTKWWSFMSSLLAEFAEYIFWVPWPHSIHLIFLMAGHLTSHWIERKVLSCSLCFSGFFFQMSSVLEGADAQTNGYFFLFAHRTLSTAAEKAGQNIIWWRSFPRFSSPVFAEVTLSELNGKVASAELPHR